MTDSPQDLPEIQPLPPAIDIGPQAQFAAIGLMVSGAASVLISMFSVCMGIVKSALTATIFMSQGIQLGNDPMFFMMITVGLVFSLTFILPLATGTGSIYGGFTLHTGGRPRRIRIAAVSMVAGYAFLILGAVPGLLFSGFTSAIVLLASPFLLILAVGTVLITFIAVREGELQQNDNATEPLETP